MKEKQYQKLFTQIRDLVDAGNELIISNPTKALANYIQAWSMMIRLSKIK